MRSSRAIGLLLIGAVASVVAVGLSRVVPAGAEVEGNRLRLEGTWIGAVGEELVRLVAIPLDPTNQRVSIQLQNVTGDPNIGGAVEQIAGNPVTSVTDFWGEAVRTGPRTFDFTIIRNTINEDLFVPYPPPDLGGRFEQIYTSVSSGTIELTAPDTLERVLWVGYFSPDQDPFADPPVYACAGPSFSTLRRVPVVPPCTP